MQNLVYVLEDDEDIREIISYALNSANFDVEGFDTADCFLKKLETARPAIALVDIMLPYPSTLSGIQMLEKIRASSKYSKLPVIFITAKSSEIDKARGLDLGADDYITKPFGVLELIARVKAVLRRYHISEDADNCAILYKDLEIDNKSRQLLKSGEEIKLTHKEFELFLYLYKNRGIAVSREQVLLKVWGEEFYGETRTVDVHIRTLRQKLADNAEEPLYIATIRGYGYKMLKE